MTERVKLTEAQRRALALLGALHDRHPRLAYGFNPRSFGGGRNAATARDCATYESRCCGATCRCDPSLTVTCPSKAGASVRPSSASAPRRASSPRWNQLSLASSLTSAELESITSAAQRCG